MSWLLNLAYLVLLLAVSPVIVYRMLVHGKYRTGWGEKFLGNLQRPASDAPCMWFHAVSVGEVLQLESVLAQLHRKRSDVDVLVTTTTVTGLAVARDKFPQHTVRYFPLDFSWAVKRAFTQIRPAAVVLVELELWPNFILEAKRRDIPLALINGRISERSYRGYRRIRPLMRRLLASIQLVAVQTETYQRRLQQLGVPEERIEVTGSIKFDGIETDRANPKTAELRAAFGLGKNERVFIAGSTQSPEEMYAVDSWLELRQTFPDLRLVVVPRHKERFDSVAAEISKRGLPLIRRSQDGQSVHKANSRDETPPVLLLDTLGELSACWGLADIAFVGGSLTNRGGQNMIEPAAYGAAVIFGPNTHNFRDVVEALLEKKGARVVQNAADMTSTVRAYLDHPEIAEQQGRVAQQLVLSQQGATARTIELVSELIPEPRPQLHGLSRAA